MKTFKLLILSAALLASQALHAQTNLTQVPNLLPPLPSVAAGIEEIGAAVASSTNWAIVGGYGHSIGGSEKANLVFADVAYNFNDFAGLVLGYDYLWDGQGHELNAVKGGATLKLPMHPLVFLGFDSLTNFVMTPFASDLIATPQGGSSVGNIITSGFDFDLFAWNKLEIHAGVQWEQRTGDGRFDGNYGLVHAGISRNF